MTDALIIQRPTYVWGYYRHCQPILHLGSWKPNLNASKFITAGNKSQICITPPILPLVISPKTMTTFVSMFDDLLNQKEMKWIPYRIIRPHRAFACLPSFWGNLGEVAQMLLKIVDIVMGEGKFVSDGTRWSDILAWIDSILQGTFLMAVPKKRTSKSKRRIRQNVWKKKALKVAKKAFSLAKSISTGNSTSFFLPQRRKK